MWALRAGENSKQKHSLSKLLHGDTAKTDSEVLIFVLWIGGFAMQNILFSLHPDGNSPSMNRLELSFVFCYTISKLVDRNFNLVLPAPNPVLHL